MMPRIFCGHCFTRSHPTFTLFWQKRHHFANKGPYSQRYGFSNSYVWMWELDHKEGWVLKNWCFQIVVLEKTLESPLDRKIKPVTPKGNQPWLFTGRADAEALILCHLMWRALIGKEPDAGKDWGQRRRGQQNMRCWRASLIQWRQMRKLEEIVEDGGPWHAAVHGVTKSWTRLSNWRTKC